MIVCWSVKGGSGVSVVSALLAMAIARHRTTTLIDVEGDQPAILGLDEEPTVGIKHWLRAGTGVRPEALARLTVPVHDGLKLLGAGTAPLPEASAVDAHLAAERLADAMPLSVVDAGVARGRNDFAAALASVADTSLLVVRNDYLAIRRASKLGLRATGVIVIDEPGRALGPRDVHDVLGVPVVLTLGWDASLARLVDAGRVVLKRSRTSKQFSRMILELGLNRGQDDERINVA